MRTYTLQEFRDFTPEIFQTKNNKKFINLTPRTWNSKHLRLNTWDTDPQRRQRPHILNNDFPPPFPKYPAPKLWITDLQGDQISQTLNTDCKHLGLQPQDTDNQYIQRPHTSNKTPNTSDSNIVTHTFNDVRDVALIVFYLFYSNVLTAGVLLSLKGLSLLGLVKS